MQQPQLPLRCEEEPPGAADAAFIFFRLLWADMGPNPVLLQS